MEHPAEFRKQCDILYRELVEANRHVNLTRITERADFDCKHVADSLLLLTAFPQLSEASPVVADIGCGAGFPSLILAMRCPKWRVTAIDSTGKKTAFVARMKELLKLDNLTVVTGRSCELNRKPEWHGRFDIVTARAVAPGAVIVNESRNFPRRGGGWILYKTPDQACEDLAALGAGWYATANFQLPEEAGTRCFVSNMERLRA